MNGGLTYREMELRKSKADAVDEVIKRFDGCCDNEQSLTILRILQASARPETVPNASDTGTKHPWHDMKNRSCPWAMGGDHCRCSQP
jgi:hypothetical protein